MATLVIGIGNPILGDDGVGWKVIERVRRLLGDGIPGVEVDCLAASGLALAERMMGFDRVVIVDAVTTGEKPPGSIWVLPLDAFPASVVGHTASTHDPSLGTALEAVKALGGKVPRDVVVVGVEVSGEFAFSENLSAAVAAAVPCATRSVFDLLGSRTRREGKSHGIP